MYSNSVRLAIFRRNLTGGGSERVIVNLANYFAQSGLKVDLVLSRAEGSLLQQVYEQVRVIDLKGSALDQKRFLKLKLPTSFQSTTSLPNLINYLRQERPTSLLTACHFSNEIGILAKHLARVPSRVVVSEHTHLSREVQQVEQSSSRLVPLTARLFYPWANGITAVSEGVAQDLAKLAKIPLERIQVIYNPIVEPTLLKKAREPVYHPWFAPGEPPVILGVGRFVKQKDFPNLIRAFEKIQQVRPARLMILGDGREAKNLKALVSELGLENQVSFPCFMQNPYAYMAKSAVFALSSTWEGFGNVLVEAMAAGTPIVSTDCESGPAEVLDNGKYGELVPVGDSDALAAAILKVLSDQIKPVDSAWLNQYTVETVAQKYAQILGVENREF